MVKLFPLVEVLCFYKEVLMADGGLGKEKPASTEGEHTETAK